MAKMSVPEKLRRVLTYLYGLRDRDIRRVLFTHGLTKEELQYGWELFHRAARGVLDVEEVPLTDDVAGALTELDGWENKWFPIAQATLTARFPQLAARLFLNLGQATGREVILTVQTLLDRLEPWTGAPAGSEEAAAAALLAVRGLNEGERKRARDLLVTIRELEQPIEAREPAVPVDPEAEVAALWTWYQEWAEIARVVVLRKDQRIRLGVSAPTSHAEGEEAPEPVTEPTPG